MAKVRNLLEKMPCKALHLKRLSRDSGVFPPVFEIFEKDVGRIGGLLSQT